jgi:hypothetical protein
MPHVSEVRAACEKHMAGVRARVAQEGRIAETQALLAAPQAATTEQRERAVAKWEAEKAARVRQARKYVAERSVEELRETPLPALSTHLVEATLAKMVGK